MSFKDFPWFREASVAAVLHVERPQSEHLYWPDLDIDLAVDSISHPERYPLISREKPRASSRSSRAARRSVSKRTRARTRKT
jgi:hypothetical protein